MLWLIDFQNDNDVRNLNFTQEFMEANKFQETTKILLRNVCVEVTGSNLQF